MGATKEAFLIYNDEEQLTNKVQFIINSPNYAYLALIDKFLTSLDKPGYEDFDEIVFLLVLNAENEIVNFIKANIIDTIKDAIDHAYCLEDMNRYIKLLRQPKHNPRIN